MDKPVKDNSLFAGKQAAGLIIGLEDAQDMNLHHKSASKQRDGEVFD